MISVSKKETNIARALLLGLSSISGPYFSWILFKIVATIGKNWKTIRIPCMHGQATLVVSKSMIFYVRFPFFGPWKVKYLVLIKVVLIR